MTETFSIVPGQVKLLWVVVPVVLILIVTLCGLAYAVSGSRNARFEVSPAGLRLRGDFYGRLIPPSDLRLEGARAVDLGAEASLKPVWRTAGTAVPGYRAGWFRLKDGEKALLYVTDPSKVAYVPTTKGYAVLLSVADPAAFIASLRRIAN
jgi:hypothetical protein